jgi:hypothetical protein
MWLKGETTMAKKFYATADEAIAANPTDPVVIHGLFCRDKCAFPRNVERINNAILQHFNK